MKQIKFWTIAALCVAAFAAFACFDVEPTGEFVEYESATLTGGEGYTIDVLLPEWTNQAEYEKKLQELNGSGNGNENQFAGVAVTGTPFTLNLAFSGFINSETGAQVIEADDPIVEMSIWYWKKNGENNGGTWTELKKIENPQFEVEGSEPLALFGRGTIPDALGYTGEGEFIRVVFYFKSKNGKETFCMKTFEEKKSEINAPKEVKAPVLLIVPLDNTLPEY